VRTYEATTGSSRARRVMSSVWLPWTISALLLLALTVTVLVVMARQDRDSRVSAAVLNGQQSMTSTSAQMIRRNLNNGLADLTGVARNLSRQSVTDGKELRPLLAGLRDLHRCYRSLYVVDRHGALVAKVGSRRHPGALPPRVSAPGIAHEVDPAGRQVLASYAPLRGPKGAGWVLAGEYDVDVLQDSLRRAEPASAWLVDRDGRALHPPSGATRYTVQDQAVLQRAAALASEAPGYEVEEGDSVPEVVAWAPVEGAGKAGDLGLGVVSSSPLDQLDAPQPPVE
jgi:hypothetical protein